VVHGSADSSGLNGCSHAIPANASHLEAIRRREAVFVQAPPLRRVVRLDHSAAEVEFAINLRGDALRCFFVSHDALRVPADEQVLPRLPFDGFDLDRSIDGVAIVHLVPVPTEQPVVGLRRRRVGRRIV